ncbi:hypothetical protein KCU74_g126, partial [Aureobasidium melanogenum]
MDENLSPHLTQTVDQARAVLSNQPVPSLHRPALVPFVKIERLCAQPKASGGSSKHLFLDQEFNRDNACDKKARSSCATLLILVRHHASKEILDSYLGFLQRAMPIRQETHEPLSIDSRPVIPPLIYAIASWAEPSRRVKDRRGNRNRFETER